MPDGMMTASVHPRQYADACERRVRRALDVAAAAERALTVAVLTWRRDEALAEARAWDRDVDTPPLFGVVLSVKACIDVKGWVTHAGSRVLADSPPATRDAPIVASLRAAGAVILAQTNMTEFAFSGLGLNPHYGTPLSPVYTAGDRVAGGSSSGAAVTVATHLVDAAIGTDTRGSARIPAAFCGTVGFRPSLGRYSTDGIVPLSPSFDVPGLLAPTVAACETIDAVLVPRPHSVAFQTVAGARFAVPRGFIGQSVDPTVLTAFDATVGALASAGALVEEVDMTYLADVGEAARRGNIVPAEAYAWHAPLLERDAARYDPRVGPRIASAATARAVDYIRARGELRLLALRYEDDMHGYDALLTPTVALEPPKLDDLGDDAPFFAINQRVLYFTELASCIDLPSLTVPIGDRSRAIGLLLTGRSGTDATLLALGCAVERAVGGTSA